MAPRDEISACQIVVLDRGGRLFGLFWSRVIFTECLGWGMHASLVGPLSKVTVASRQVWVGARGRISVVLSRMPTSLSLSQSPMSYFGPRATFHSLRLMPIFGLIHDQLAPQLHNRCSAAAVHRLLKSTCLVGKG